MATQRPQPFYWRAFVTFYVIISFVVITASGVILYVSPPGRVANWSEWTIGSLTKANWQAVHTVFAFLFVVAAAFHIYFNWRVILNYLTRKLSEGIRRKRELALSSAVGLTVFGLTLAGTPPFGTVMTVGESLKNSWTTPATEPPVPHAELWTLSQLADNSRIPLEQVLVNLNEAGISPADTDVSLLDLAGELKKTPQEIYRAAVRDANPAAMPLTEGGGYGRRTVQQIADQANVPVAAGLERLRQNGIEAKPGSTIRELASQSGKTPLEIVKLLRG